MSARVIWLFVVMIAVAGATGAQEKEKEKPRKDPALVKLAQDFLEAFNAKDVAKAASFYAEDAILNLPDQPAMHGRQQVQVWLQKQMDQGPSSLTIGQDDAEVHGSMAYDAGPYTMTVVSAGKTVQLKGRHVRVFRQVEKRWVIAREMFQPEPPPVKK